MKRLLIIAATAWLTLSGAVWAQSPDDRYIEIYRIIQEGDQFAASGQSEFAHQRYTEARTQLRKLQASYPNWNQELIEFRLRLLDAKLAAAAKPAGGPAAAPGGTNQPPAQPQAAPPGQPAPAKPQAEADDRDEQIKALREQVVRLQNERQVLEAKLKEALAAQPAAVDPRELAKAEERIKALEKETAVLKVSLEAAEVKAAQPNESGLVELRKQLSQSRQKLSEQNDAMTALRQERDLLQQQLQQRPDDTLLKSLRAENETLRKQLSERVPAAPAPPSQAPSETELTSTKAALQSSRETISSLQVRLRALQDERDALERKRKELENKVASATRPAAVPGASDSSQIRRLQKERDELQKKLNEANRQLAEARGKAKPAPGVSQPSSAEAASMRARLDALEAHKVPYTADELALFKQPQEPPALATGADVQPVPQKEPPPGAAPLLAEAQRAFAARRFDEAEKKYAEALRLDDRNINTLQRLAAAQLEQNRPQDAEANLKRALEQNPRDARTLLLMGIAKFDQNKFDDAFDSLSRSAALDPQNAETQNYLGITLSQKGQRAAAETALRKAIQISPNYASAHYNLAVIYATQQPPFMELARWHYQKALAYGHPQNPDLEKIIERKQAASQK